VDDRDRDRTREVVVVGVEQGLAVVAMTWFPVRMA
jgi:hypothetical protein